MKPKHIKYKEAVERNISFVQRVLLQQADAYASWKNHTLERVKTCLGIRKTDSSHDEIVKTILTKINGVKEKKS